MHDRPRGICALLAAVLLGAAAVSVACTKGTTTQGGSTDQAKKGPIRVGSKIDGEGSLLGQMILVMLADNGFEVEDDTRTGATDVVRQALLTGQIDIYPEYTANAIEIFHKDAAVDPAVLRDATETYDTAKMLDEADGVVWLARAPANNTWAVAVPRQFSEANKITSMDQWAAYINKGGTVKIAGSAEFFSSEAAMPAFEKAYGFKLRKDQIVTQATGDTAGTEKAAAEGDSGVNAAMAYGTDGTIAALDLVVLSDPKGAQPIYQPAPTVRKDVLDKYPEIATILSPVFEKLTLEVLQGLNGQVAIEGMDPKKVATDFLTAEGLLK
jgi:osmoprotectant transport system substrate-binding protein